MSTNCLNRGASRGGPHKGCAVMVGADPLSNDCDRATRRVTAQGVPPKSRQRDVGMHNLLRARTRALNDGDCWGP